MFSQRIFKRFYHAPRSLSSREFGTNWFRIHWVLELLDVPQEILMHGHGCMSWKMPLSICNLDLGVGGGDAREESSVFPLVLHGSWTFPSVRNIS